MRIAIQPRILRISQEIFDKAYHANDLLRLQKKLKEMKMIHKESVNAKWNSAQLVTVEKETLGPRQSHCLFTFHLSMATLQKHVIKLLADLVT